MLYSVHNIITKVHYMLDQVLYIMKIFIIWSKQLYIMVDLHYMMSKHLYIMVDLHFMLVKPIYVMYISHYIMGYYGTPKLSDGKE